MKGVSPVSRWISDLPGLTIYMGARSVMISRLKDLGRSATYAEARRIQSRQPLPDIGILLLIPILGMRGRTKTIRIICSRPSPWPGH
jgi:hypothetical protein